MESCIGMLFTQNKVEKTHSFHGNAQSTPIQKTQAVLYLHESNIMHMYM